MGIFQVWPESRKRRHRTFASLAIDKLLCFKAYIFVRDGQKSDIDIILDHPISPCVEFKVGVVQLNLVSDVLTKVVSVELLVAIHECQVNFLQRGHYCFKGISSPFL